MTKSIAIAGIHTGIGKTIASAVIAEALSADYWKPVQAGIEERDIELVRNLISNSAQRVHSESILLKQPMSPHAAALAEGVAIDFTRFAWPNTSKMLLVETAGGLLSPISENKTMADFITHFQLPVILVVANYLGSINHTLLTLEVLKARGIPLIGMVVSGPNNHSSESFIEQYSGSSIIARIPQLDIVNANSIKNCAEIIKDKLQKLI